MRELLAKNLIKLRKQAFEELCGRLLDKEYEVCFEPDAVEIQREAPEDFADGGRDLEVRIHQEPVRRGHWSLLPKEMGITRWFSCKTAKDDDGRGWKDQVVADIDPPGVVDGRKRALFDDAVERAKLGDPPPLDLLQMLADGGSYWVLINVEGDLIPRFETTAVLRLEFWIEQVLGRKADLSGRIKVKDATFLAKVFNERPFALSEEQCRQLDVDEPEFLWSWERWSTALPEERRKLYFEVDDERQEMMKRLAVVLQASEAVSDPAQRVFRIAGAPGVGKTRLVHHVLEQPAHAVLHTRVRYTKHAEEARKWIDRGGLAQSPDLMLVVDEVPSDGANELWRAFQRSSAGDARLILIGPRDDADVGKPDPAMSKRP